RELNKERYGAVQGTAWTADGRAVVYSAGGPLGASSLFRLPVRGQHPPTRLPYAFNNAFEPAITPTRQRLVYVRDDTARNLWRLDTPPRGRYRPDFPSWLSTRPMGANSPSTRPAPENWESGPATPTVPTACN